MKEKIHIDRRYKKFRTWIVFAVFCLLSSVAGASVLDTKDISTLNLVMGELVNLKAYELTRVSIADPAIADINSADDKNIVIIAKNVGQTALFLWDEYGRRTIRIQVNSQDLVMIKERIETLLSAVQIEGITLTINEQEGMVICSGILNEAEKDAFNQIVSPFMDDLILLFKETKREDLVLIDAQVTELNTTLTQHLGIDWQTSASTDLVINYSETLPAFHENLKNYFKIGDFQRTSTLLGVVNAIVEEGKGRILSKPKLLVKSGEEASFLVGGEIPIRTISTASSGETSENVEFKEYGISMLITPTVTNEDKIDIGLKLEITEIDSSVQVGSDVGYTKRNTETQLLLDNEQTVVIAGLIKNRTGENIKKVPYLAEIPLIGALFRKRSTAPFDQDQELVISLTPKIVLQSKPEKKALERKKKDLNIRDFSQTERPVVIPRYISALDEQENSDKRSKDLASVYQGIPQEMSAYVYDIQKRIFDAIQFPAQAQEHGWEGVVKLELLILEDGTLAFVLVDDSSGFEVFDENAVQTARRAAPFGAFPRGTNLQELNLTIPIVYNLN